MSLQPCGLMPLLPFVLYFADYDGYFTNCMCLPLFLCMYVCALCVCTVLYIFLCMHCAMTRCQEEACDISVDIDLFPHVSALLCLCSRLCGLARGDRLGTYVYTHVQSTQRCIHSTYFSACTEDVPKRGMRHQC